MTDLDRKVRELRAALSDVERIAGTQLTIRPSVILLDAVNRTRAILDEYDRRGAALVEADGTLHEAREFINRYSDVRDGDYGAPEPNEAMHLVHTIDQTAATISQEVGK